MTKGFNPPLIAGMCHGASLTTLTKILAKMISESCRNQNQNHADQSDIHDGPETIHDEGFKVAHGLAFLLGLCV
jgi:hypothetical protein